MDDMIKKISAYPNGSYLRLIWDYKKTIVERVLDTIYETDNGLDENDKGYQEFYACVIKIKKVVRNLDGKELDINQLIEISRETQPTSIELKDGTIVWEKLS